jgi:hypothetical protein
MTPSSETVSYDSSKLGGLRRGRMANWMAGAVKPSRKGVFGAKAARAGMTTSAFARQKASAGGTLGKEARLAQTFAKFRPKQKGRLASRLTSMRAGGAFKSGSNVVKGLAARGGY